MEAEPFASFLRRRGASPSCSFLFRPRVHRSILRSWPSLHLRSLPPLPTRSTTLRCMAHEHAFQLRLDPLTGTSEWVVVENTEHESQNHKALLATTSYLDMLNDSYRNAAFHKAIRNTITKPCRVIDIGAGTGLLSMMAARTMEERGGGEVEGKVTAFESYLPMGKLMRKVLLDNGMEKKIKVVHKRSDEAELGVDVDSRAEVLVSEILDSELLGEGLIPTLQHAHDVLLVENPQVVPYRATIYGQLVESTSLWKLHDLHSCEAEISDGTCLVPFGLERIMCVKPKQHAMQCSAMSKELKLMSDPFRIFEFEFSKRPESQRKFNLHIRTTNDGIVHAIISWWVLQLDNTGCISYSTAPAWIRHNSPETPTHAPGNKDWCDHWKQCVWFVPGMGIPVKKDAGVVCQVIQDITSISFSLKNVVEAVQPTSDFDAQYPQITLPPERVGIYGDKHWRTAFLTAAKNAMQVKDSPFCLIMDDSFFLSVVMARISRNACISSIFPGLKENASLYLDAVANANNFAKGRVEVIGKRASLLSVDDLHGRKVDLLIAEPFYYGNEGSLPWQNLRFWKERTLLDAFLSEEVLIMPCKGILKACAMSLPDLWRSRCSLKSIEGFDHSRVNEMLGACGDLIPAQDGPCLPYFIWQSGMYKVLSEAAVIMEFNFSECIQQCSGKTTIAFTESGMCHGFALWIDWVIDERNSIVISTGPDNRYWKQGVKLLNKPVTVNTPTSCGMDEFCLSEIEASFNPTSGQLEIQCNFGF